MKRVSLILLLLMLSVTSAWAEKAVFAFEDSIYSVFVAKTITPKPIAQGIEGKLTYAWASSDESVATVSKGTVKGVSGGSATISCIATGNDGSTYEASCIVDVIVPIKSITAEESSVVLTTAPFGSATLHKPEDPVDGHYYMCKPNIVIEPFDATIQELEWSTDDWRTATVSKDGVIFGGMVPGTTFVTGKATDGSNKSVKIKVTVPAYFFTDDDITITEPSGAELGYILSSYNGYNYFDKDISGGVVSLEHLDDVDGMSMVRLVPLKAGSGTISFIHNGRVVQRVKVKVEHSAVYDDVSYPYVSVSSLISEQDSSIGKKTHVTCEVIKIEKMAIEGATERDKMYQGRHSALVYGMVIEDDMRRYVVFEHDLGLTLKQGETYTIYGEVSKFVEYTTETGLSYDCPYFVGGHINK